MARLLIFLFVVFAVIESLVSNAFMFDTTEWLLMAILVAVTEKDRGGTDE